MNRCEFGSDFVENTSIVENMSKKCRQVNSNFFLSRARREHVEKLSTRNFFCREHVEKMSRCFNFLDEDDIMILESLWAASRPASLKKHNFSTINFYVKSWLSARYWITIPYLYELLKERLVDTKLLCTSTSTSRRRCSSLSIRFFWFI